MFIELFFFQLLFLKLLFYKKYFYRWKHWIITQLCLKNNIKKKNIYIYLFPLIGLPIANCICPFMSLQLVPEAGLDAALPPAGQPQELNPRSWKKRERERANMNIVFLVYEGDNLFFYPAFT